MKYFLIAGEHSGDQHAGVLMKKLAANDPNAEFSFLGGDLMAETGGSPVVHIEEMAFMGFTQVLTNLGKIRNNFAKAKKAIIEFHPDVVILIDYPGFNMRMAKWAKNKGFKTFYYIVPAVWAWNTKRVHKIKKSCDKIFPILPFEPDFFARFDIESEYIGNPVNEKISTEREKLSSQPKVGKQIAVLPGSRKQEIERILPIMMSVVPELSDHSFVIAAMEDHKDLYDKYITDDNRVSLVFNKPLEVLHSSDAAIVTSGTATLETALMGVPQIVCYKANYLSYAIAKKLIKVPFISLVNLILEGPAIPELIQKDCKTDYIVGCLKTILPGGPNHSDQLEISRMVKEKLGDEQMSDRLSSMIISALNAYQRHGKIF